MPEEGIPTVPVTGPTDVEAKMWYLSSELWSALVAIGAFIAQGMGLVEVPVPAEIQAALVMVWMFILRAFKTRSPIAWTKKQLQKMNGVA